MSAAGVFFNLINIGENTYLKRGTHVLLRFREEEEQGLPDAPRMSSVILLPSTANYERSRRHMLHSRSPTIQTTANQVRPPTTSLKTMFPAK